MHDLLTVPEVARIFRVTPVTVHRWVQKGVLDAVRLPRGTKRQSLRIRRATVDRILVFAHEGRVR